MPHGTVVPLVRRSAGGHGAPPAYLIGANVLSRLQPMTVAARRKRARKVTRTLIVDRWVDKHVARAELDGQTVEVPRALLPEDAEADAVMRVERGESRVTITLDVDAASRARQDAERLTRKLRGRDRGGSVTL